MRIEESLTVPASRAVLWKLVGDPASYPRFLSGVTRCEPETRGRPRRGARYSLRLQVGAAQVGGVIEIVEFTRAVELAWVGVTGIDQRGRWRLRDTEDGGTEVTLRLTYSVPGGLPGLVADALAAPMVRGHVKRSLEALEKL
jgi:uncharacterized membrane protein